MVIGPTRQSSVAIDRIISDLAQRNDGLVPTARLVTRVNRKAVTNRIDAGVLIPLAPGICILRGTPVTPLRRALAVAILRPDAWVSHTAAALRWKATIDDRFVHADVSVVRPHSMRIAAVRSHRASTRPPHRRIVRFAAGHVSAPEQCIAELADVLDARRLELAMDSLIHARTASLTRLVQLLEGWSPNRRGRRDLRQLVDDRLNGAGIIRSWLEQEALRVLGRAGLPAPVRNHRVRVPNGPSRVLNLAWPELRIAVEADSWKHHASPGDWRATRVRDRQLTAAGWIVVPCVVSDTRDPSELIDTLRRLMARRAAR